MSRKKGVKVFKRQEIRQAFKLLGLATQSQRKRKLFRGLVQPKVEKKVINYITLDNAAAPKKDEKSKHAKLE